MESLVRQISATHLVKLGQHQMAVKIEGGIAVASVRRVRLSYGTHLYCATKSPKADDKVVPYQPGYMALVAAMGGKLLVPPTVRDPVSGEIVANPRIKYAEGTAMIESIAATAVCLVRDALGNWHHSMMTVVIDAELMLRQVLVKLLAREDIVKTIPARKLQKMEDSGELDGWIVKPFLAGYFIAGKATAGAVIEALQDQVNLSKTLRQVAHSKAERLACDHNPVLRMSWLYGELLMEVKNHKTGQIKTVKWQEGWSDEWFPLTPQPFVEVDVVGWTDQRDQAQIDAFVRSISEVNESGIMEVLDVSDGDIDAPADPEDRPRQITEKVEAPALVIPRQPEPAIAAPAPVQAPAPQPAPAPVAPPAPAPVEAAAPAAAEDPRNGARRRSIAKCEGQLPPADVAHCRKAAGVAADAAVEAIPALLLESYLNELYQAKDAIQ